MALTNTTFTNGRVSLTYDLIFGLSVLSEDYGWLPWDQLDADDRGVVRAALDHNPTCPSEWSAIVYDDKAAAADRAQRKGQPAPGEV